MNLKQDTCGLNRDYTPIIEKSSITLFVLLSYVWSTLLSDASYCASLYKLRKSCRALRTVDFVVIRYVHSSLTCGFLMCQLVASCFSFNSVVWFTSLSTFDFFFIHFKATDSVWNFGIWIKALLNSLNDSCNLYSPVIFTEVGPNLGPKRLTFIFSLCRK